MSIKDTLMTALTQPALFIPHGGGPCFFMDDPNGTWTGMGRFLRELPGTLPEPPKAILVVSAHWEAQGFQLTSNERPPMLFDYYNFPPHTYELTFDAAGAPEIATKAARLLAAAGLDAGLDQERGYDHGVFVPLLVAWPDANVPVIEMSLDSSLDPALHFAAGKALAPLRDEGVLMIGSGMSFHNMRAYGDPRATQPSEEFDHWLTAAVEASDGGAGNDLLHWSDAPAGRFSHPQEEHLIPLMVVAGAASGPGRKVYSEKVLETVVSAFRFD